MEILSIVVIVLVASALMFVINALIFKAIVNKALKTRIKPYLYNLGFSVKKVEFVGLFKTGDFESNGFSIRPFFLKGSPMQSTYIYLYIQKQNASNQIRITARINTFFLSIRSVEYSAGLVS